MIEVWLSCWTVIIFWVELSWVCNLSVKTYKDMYLQTARRPNTQSLTQTRVPSKPTNTKHEEEEIVCQLSVQDRQKFIAKRQRHWHKDKDMHTKTKTHTQRQRHSHKDQAMSLACLGKPGRALWRARDADIPRSWGDSPCAKRNSFVHFISIFFIGIIYQRTNSTTQTSEKWAEGKKSRKYGK